MAFNYCPDCGSKDLEHSNVHAGKGDILDCCHCGMRHHVIEEAKPSLPTQEEGL